MLKVPQTVLPFHVSLGASLTCPALVSTHFKGLSGRSHVPDHLLAVIAPNHRAKGNKGAVSVVRIILVTPKISSDREEPK